MKRTSLLLILFLTNFIVVFACFWDYDTIEMERQQFPSVIELISGKFLRHSPEFHYWRIKDREKKLRLFPDSLNLYDDLAVSYSKIGNNKKAIEIILEKDSLNPGLYETKANLGTFYLHDGQIKSGIESIREAVKINPDAHFGRERYQRYLAEYVLGKMKNGAIVLPLDNSFYGRPESFVRRRRLTNFYDFLLSKYKSNFDSLAQKTIRELPAEKLEQAIIGVMGMMKFGTHNSPVLLEVLGDLLMNSGWYKGARQLAARAYLKASYEVSHDKAGEGYRKKAELILFHQRARTGKKEFALSEIEDLLQEEVREGDSLFDKIRTDEIAWINSRKDPELEFTKKYYEDPLVSVRLRKEKGSDKGSERYYLKDTADSGRVDYRPVHEKDMYPDTNQVRIIDSIFSDDDKVAGDQMIESDLPEIPDGSLTIRPLYILLIVCIVAFLILIRIRRK